MDLGFLSVVDEKEALLRETAHFIFDACGNGVHGISVRRLPLRRVAQRGVYG